MLLLVRSRGVDFTAFITSRLSITVKGQVIVLMSITVKGQVIVLMMITFIAPATEGTSALSPSLLVVFVTFVELAKEKFALLDSTLTPNKLGLS